MQGGPLPELSMKQELRLHPDCMCDAVRRISVQIERKARGLVLVYGVEGEIGALSLTPAGPSLRTDGLWQHTCFEAFLRSQASGYCEFNFSSSTAWAAYRFDGYRAGMRALELTVAPRIETQTAPVTYRLTAGLGDLPPGDWHLGLSAVIEERSGRKSYWALTHPPGKPDFHHADSFALALAEG